MRRVGGPAVAGVVGIVRADVSDDGLPASPGVPTLTWSLVSGPGGVTFGEGEGGGTPVLFAAAGTYVLRATADDGAFRRSADLTVEVAPAVAPPSGSVVRADGGLELRFGTEAGRSYGVYAREDLLAGDWVLISTVPAGAAGTARVALPAEAPTRFYRIVTPAP